MREIGAPTKWVRRAITAVGIFTGTMTPAAAQQMGTMPLIAVLSTRTPEDGPTRAFIQELGALGYVEGRNIRIEVRWAGGDNQKIPTLAAELAAAKPRVIVTNGEPGIRAAKAATTSDTPIVMANVGDPVAAGFVKSLAHPGENITGMSNLGSGLVAKRLELLHETVPHPECTAVLRNPDDRSLDPVYWKEATGAGQRLGSNLLAVQARGAGELDTAFAEAARHGCRAMLEMPNAAFTASRNEIVALAEQYQIAAIYDTREFVDSGGLMSYGPDFADMYRRAADYVDKILKGANPADLPVQQPSKFELVINVNTAKAIGITVPQSLLQRADEVIE
jgi:ABC-type uncharacterized transport system substrate-binding protein